MESEVEERGVVGQLRVDTCGAGVVGSLIDVRSGGAGSKGELYAGGIGGAGGGGRMYRCRMKGACAALGSLRGVPPRLGAEQARAQPAGPGWAPMGGAP